MDSTKQPPDKLFLRVGTPSRIINREINSQEFVTGNQVCNFIQYFNGGNKHTTYRCITDYCSRQSCQATTFYLCQKAITPTQKKEKVLYLKEYKSSFSKAFALRTASSVFDKKKKSIMRLLGKKTYVQITMYHRNC